MSSIGKLGVRAAAAAALLLFASVAGPAAAQRPDAIACEDLQIAMFDTLRTIENALGLSPAASDAILRLDPALFDAIPDKGRFLEAARGIRRVSDLARDGGAPTGLAPPMPFTAVLQPLSGSVPFVPKYPNPSTDANYAVLHPLGLINQPWDRCGGDSYEYYVVAMQSAEATLNIAQLACDVAGCDPTGLGCVAVCGAVKAVQLAWKLAAIPIQACNAWGMQVDSAENEAAYRNILLVLGDLSAHDDRVMAKLTSESGKIDTLLAQLTALQTRLERHDVEMKRLINTAVMTLIANQREIIKLLKTPEGRRPGFPQEGY